jgi:predicted Zn-dependent protease with MMP-like domain
MTRRHRDGYRLDYFLPLEAGGAQDASARPPRRISTARSGPSRSSMTREKLTTLAADVVTATQRHLPPDIRAVAIRVPVHYQAGPDADVIAEGFEPDILGLFTGDPHGTEFAQDNPAPPQILLYLENLWDYAEGDARYFRDEVRLTYLHELGHYLGWDEDELTARGLD